MASKAKKSGGDFVLESKHLVGLFLLLVVIFGVVFTLGYLMGRSQYDSKLRTVVGTPPGNRKPRWSPNSRKPTIRIPIGISIIPPIRKQARIICSRLRSLWRRSRLPRRRPSLHRLHRSRRNQLRSREALARR